jgi:hypothetical protein
VNLVVGALVRAIQAAKDDGWSPLSRARLVDAMVEARKRLRQHALSRAVERAEEAAKPPLVLPDDLSEDERGFLWILRERLSRKGARLHKVFRAYRCLALYATRADGIEAKQLVEVVSDRWCSNYAGTVISVGEVANRLSRTPLTPSKPPSEAPGHEEPHAVPTDPARRGRGVRRPNPPPVR